MGCEHGEEAAKNGCDRDTRRDGREKAKPLGTKGGEREEEMGDNKKQSS